MRRVENDKEVDGTKQAERRENVGGDTVPAQAGAWREAESEGEAGADSASFLWYFLPFLSVVFFYAAPGFLFWHLARQTVLHILLGLFLLAVVNGLTAFYHGWQRHGAFLERAAILMKYGLIPFHFALAVAAMVSGDFSMGAGYLWGRTVIISTWDVLLVVFLLAFLSGMGYALAAIETAVGEERLHLLWALLHGIAQLIPLVDLLALIWFIAVQEGRARLLSLFALLFLLAALVAAGLFTLRFFG
ncbi:MAG: hypothetical protein ACTTKW_08985 [Schwartzia sp. (in: firmicutes)]